MKEELGIEACQTVEKQKGSPGGGTFLLSATYSLFFLSEPLRMGL